MLSDYLDRFTCAIISALVKTGVFFGRILAYVQFFIALLAGLAVVALAVVLLVQALI
ncbi:MAG: hypothetical protein LBS70_05380 [Candidatus Accumulibacter sp.]|jgi:hypothetical protein|nr:hypothetical protein [Accumulibacter sp.]